MSNRHFSIVLDELKRDRYEDTMSDVVCWLDGFTSAGKEYQPNTLHILKEIQADIKRAYDTIPPVPPKVDFAGDYETILRDIRNRAIQGIGANRNTSNQKLQDIKQMAESLIDAIPTKL